MEGTRTPEPGEGRFVVFCLKGWNSRAMYVHVGARVSETCVIGKAIKVPSRERVTCV